MRVLVELKQCKETDKGTEIKLLIPKMQLCETIIKKCINKAELRLDDGRSISAEQRKKIYATLRDIADYTGYYPEEEKRWMKFLHWLRTGENEDFSLADCSMDTAREFINTILEYAIEEGVPLSEEAINRADDIGKYLYFCLKHKKCAVCGQKGEIHHVDAIGMGNDRRKVDDSDYRKICLCRTHHTIAHQKGMPSFEQSYKVYGIVMKDE